MCVRFWHITPCLSLIKHKNAGLCRILKPSVCMHAWAQESQRALREAHVQLERARSAGAALEVRGAGPLSRVQVHRVQGPRNQLQSPGFQAQGVVRLWPALLSGLYDFVALPTTLAACCLSLCPCWQASHLTLSCRALDPKQLQGELKPVCSCSHVLRCRGAAARGRAGRAGRAPRPVAVGQRRWAPPAAGQGTKAVYHVLTKTGSV